MPKLGRQARLLNLKLDHKLISSFTLCLKEGPPKSADPRIVKNWVRVQSRDGQLGLLCTGNGFKLSGKKTLKSSLRTKVSCCKSQIASQIFIYLSHTAARKGVGGVCCRSYSRICSLWYIALANQGRNAYIFTRTSVGLTVLFVSFQQYLYNCVFHFSRYHPQAPLLLVFLRLYSPRNPKTLTSRKVPGVRLFFSICKAQACQQKHPRQPAEDAEPTVCEATPQIQALISPCAPFLIAHTLLVNYCPLTKPLSPMTFADFLSLLIQWIR